jgi:hypothetical protein
MSKTNPFILSASPLIFWKPWGGWWTDIYKMKPW